MKNLPLFLFSAFIGLSMLCCTSEVKVESGETKPAFDQQWADHYIDSINNKVSELFKAKDSVALASFYWPDAEMLPANAETIKGDGILKAWGEMVRMGMSEFTFKVTDLRGDDKFMIETGDYQMIDAQGKLFDRGKYLVIHEKRNGEWKIFRDVGNTSLPAAK
jgi:ketosteroid isomerase-like protein